MSSHGIPKMAAAGGLVFCGGHVLFIRKHGLWDIPKGKLKKKGKENPEPAAIREIAEETGLDSALLSIRAPVCKTSYISYYSGKPFDKTVHWFLLDYAGELTDALTPDMSEDIDLCRWIHASDFIHTIERARPYLQPAKLPLQSALDALRQ